MLVVDDEPGLRDLACRTLEAEGYRTLEAGHGAEALEVMESAPDMVDLVVTDVVMPGMDGRELARELRRARPGLRVLYVSGYPADSPERTLATPAVLDAPCLRKPFTAAALERAVREQLEA